MGNEIKINQLNGFLKTAAEQANVNKDRKLTGDEIPVFFEYADKLVEAGLVAENYKETLGLETKAEATEVKADSEKEMTRKEIRAQKRADAAQAVENKAKEIKGDDPEARYSTEVYELTKEALKEDGLTSQERKALRDFRRTAVAADSDEVVIDAVMNQKNKEIEGTTGNPETMSGQDVVTDKKLTRTSYVKRNAKKEIKAEGNWDKDVKKAFNDGNGKQVVTGKRTMTTSAARIQAANNDVEQSVIQTNKEVDKQLNDKRMELLNSMVGKTVKERDDLTGVETDEDIQLVYKDDNGNWHLDGLTQEIKHFIGADLELNRDARKDRLVSEFNKLHARLEVVSGQQLSREDVREMVRLCGYDIEDKDWRQIIAGAVTGGIIGVGAGAIGAKGDQDVIIPGKDISIHNYIEIPEILDITKDIIIEIPGETIVIPGNLTTAAALGFIIPAVVGALNGLKDKGQIPVVPSNFSEESPEALVKQLKAEGNPYADIYGALAIAFRKEGPDGQMVWDREGFKDFLNHIAGNGNGILNKEELLGAYMAIKEKKTDEVTEDPVEYCDVEYEQNTETLTESKDVTYIHRRQGGDSWAGIVQAYYPDLVAKYGIWGKDGAIKKLQKALAVDENGNYNQEIFRNIITSTDLPKEMKLPSTIEEFERVDGTVKAVKIKAGGRYSAMETVGRNEVQVTTVPGKTTVIARDMCNPNITASGSSKEEALARLKAANPNKNYRE